MATDISTIEWHLVARDQATAVFKGVTSSLERVQLAWKNLAATFAATGLATAATAIVAATIDAERSSARLDAALKSTGLSAGITRHELDSLAETLKGSTAFDDDDLRKGITALLRFREVQGDVFRDAAKLAPDLASALGIDLVSAYTKLGRALQDPTTGMKGLREAGVKLSESQIALAKSLQDVGDFAGAQRIVLRELLKSVGGSAGDENKGLYGASTAATRAWDDLLKAIGKTEAGQTGAKLFFQNATGWMTEFRNVIEAGDWMERLTALGVFFVNRNPTPFKMGLAPKAGPGGPSIEDQALANIGAASAESARMEAALQASVDLRADMIIEKRRQDADKAFKEAQKQMAEAIKLNKEQVFKNIDDIFERDDEAIRQRVAAATEASEEIAAARKLELSQVLKESDDASEREEERMRVAAGIGAELKKTGDIGKDVGLIFSSAMGELIRGGGKSRDVVKALVQDIAQLGAKMLILEPIAKNIGGMFKGLGTETGNDDPGKVLGGFGSSLSGFFSNLVGSFDTGTAFVPRTGLALVHRGERITPANQNTGGAGATYYIDARGADSAAVARLERVIVELNGSIEHRAVTVVAQQAQRGGAFSAAVRGV